MQREVKAKGKYTVYVNVTSESGRRQTINCLCEYHIESWNILVRRIKVATKINNIFIQ